MGGFGGPELLVVFLVVLLVFGPSRIPEVARGIGKAMREVRRLTTELQREINLADAEDATRKLHPESPPPVSSTPAAPGAPAGPGAPATPGAPSTPVVRPASEGPVPREGHGPAKAPDDKPDQETA